MFAGYLQDLVYKLSEVGKAIENNDLPKAASVFGSGTDTDWVQKANIALNKVSLIFQVVEVLMNTFV